MAIHRRQPSQRIAEGLEDNRLVTVPNDAVLGVGQDSPGKDLPFNIGSASGQLRRRIPVAHPDGVLFDDRPLVQVCGDVVRRCTNQFHAALFRLLVRIGAYESGKKLMVNVYHRNTKFLEEVVGKNLHVPRKDNEVDIALQKREDLSF